jgi:hypothetical protein
MNHCIVKAFGFLALSFLVSSSIKAQTHACGGSPAGSEVQVGEAPGSNGVAPTPLCDWVNRNQSQGSRAPPPLWSDQWGAIATDSASGKIGAAENMGTKSLAVNVALNQCHINGGNQCRLLLSYYNQCGVMLVGDSGISFLSAASLEEATQSGIKKCSAFTTHCRIYYSGCSLPVRIQ